MKSGPQLDCGPLFMFCHQIDLDNLGSQSLLQSIPDIKFLGQTLKRAAVGLRPTFHV